MFCFHTCTSQKASKKKVLMTTDLCNTHPIEHLRFFNENWQVDSIVYISTESKAAKKNIVT